MYNATLPVTVRTTTGELNEFFVKALNGATDQNIDAKEAEPRTTVLYAIAKPGKSHVKAMVANFQNNRELLFRTLNGIVESYKLGPSSDPDNVKNVKEAKRKFHQAMDVLHQEKNLSIKKIQDNLAEFRNEVTPQNKHTGEVVPPTILTDSQNNQSLNTTKTNQLEIVNQRVSATPMSNDIFIIKKDENLETISLENYEQSSREEKWQNKLPLGSVEDSPVNGKSETHSSVKKTTSSSEILSALPVTSTSELKVTDSMTVSKADDELRITDSTKLPDLHKQLMAKVDNSEDKISPNTTSPKTDHRIITQSTKDSQTNVVTTTISGLKSEEPNSTDNRKITDGRNGDKVIGTPLQIRGATTLSNLIEYLEKNPDLTIVGERIKRHPDNYIELSFRKEIGCSPSSPESGIDKIGENNGNVCEGITNCVRNNILFKLNRLNKENYKAEFKEFFEFSSKALSAISHEINRTDGLNAGLIAKTLKEINVKIIKFEKSHGLSHDNDVSPPRVNSLYSNPEPPTEERESHDMWELVRSEIKYNENLIQAINTYSERLMKSFSVLSVFSVLSKQNTKKMWESLLILKAYSDKLLTALPRIEPKNEKPLDSATRMEIVKAMRILDEEEYMTAVAHVSNYYRDTLSQPTSVEHDTKKNIWYLAGAGISNQATKKHPLYAGEMAEILKHTAETDEAIKSNIYDAIIDLKRVAETVNNIQREKDGGGKNKDFSDGFKDALVMKALLSNMSAAEIAKRFKVDEKKVNEALDEPIYKNVLSMSQWKEKVVEALESETEMASAEIAKRFKIDEEKVIEALDELMNSTLSLAQRKEQVNLKMLNTKKYEAYVSETLTEERRQQKKMVDAKKK